VLVAVVAAAGLAPAERGGALAGLKPGMPVALRESGGRFEISVFDGLPGPLGHALIAVGDDYIVVRHIAGVAETWIPVTSIACVKTVKTVNDPR
jgi:hypothetical protein